MPIDWSALADRAVDNAAGVASFSKGAVSGVGEGVASMAEGLWSVGKGTVTAATRAATDAAYREATFDKATSLARSAADYGGRLIDDPVTRAQAYEKAQQLAASLKQQFLDARDKAASEGNLAEFYGKIAGRGGFEVGMVVIPIAKLGALGKVGEAAEAAKVAKAAEVAEGIEAVKAGAAVQECRAASAAAKVIKVESAAAVNEAMIEAGRLPAWKAGTEVSTEVVPKGTQFQMVVTQQKAEELIRGSQWFGGFATSEYVPSQAFARDKLVILESMKETVSHVVTVETTADQVIRRGITGALDNYTGGVQQVEFVGNKALKLVGEPMSLPVK